MLCGQHLNVGLRLPKFVDAHAGGHGKNIDVKSLAYGNFGTKFRIGAAVPKFAP